MHGDVYDFLGDFISPLMVLFTMSLITQDLEMITRCVIVFKRLWGNEEVIVTF